MVAIFINYNYFNSKSRNAIVYNYVENYIETNYGIGRENLKSEENNYLRGMGVLAIEVKDTVTKKYYFLEVDIKDDYSLIYIKDLTEVHRKNQAD
ncbi:histidine kinase [Lysinibacillus sp. F5]|uniref:Histidine kinase n=1 Tax=Lysinibacillus fusiformis TaxID=28031 RepID=A0A2I0V382_9BACI|nr:histidine kinase [Lysinibacillus sp. F5]PKU52767.1 histidine kinase [Lysinibacillus fusiformis]